MTTIGVHDIVSRLKVQTSCAHITLSNAQCNAYYVYNVIFHKMCDVFVNIAKGLQIIAIPWVMTHLTWDCESVALDILMGLNKTMNPFSNRWCHKEVKRNQR